MSKYFPEPYASIPPSQMDRCFADVAINDKQFIQSICPGRGIINFVIQSIFSSIVTECKQRGITSFSPENRDTLIEIIQRRASACADLPTSGRDDPRPTSSVRARDPNPTDLSSDVLKSSSGRSGQRRGVAGSKTKGDKVSNPKETQD